MSETDKVFAGAIPEFYDTYLVPVFFAPYADDLAQRVSLTKPSRVLETAAGTGVVTRALAPLLKRTARYIATDLNQPMIDRGRAQQAGDRRIEWRQADALKLPFADGEFDAVCCAFGVMFFPDRSAGYREARRVLKRGGRFHFNVWDGLNSNDFSRLVAAAAAAAFPDDPPGFLGRTPYGYHDVRQIEAELRGAGFANVEIVTLPIRSEAASARAVAIGVCQGTPLRSEIEARDPNGLERVTGLAAEAIVRALGPGKVYGDMQAHVIAATA